MNLAWTARAKPIFDPVVEVGFCISDGFYHGPENGFPPEDWQRLQEPLYRPALPLHGNVVLSSDAAVNPEELIRHYRDVLRLRERYGFAARRVEAHFWLYPVLFSPGRFDIPFAWHDVWKDTSLFLDALERGGEGLVFHDYEEHWQIEILAFGDHLFIRHTDPDDAAEFACVSCRRDRLVAQVAPLRRRCLALIGDMTAALGRDFWNGSTYRIGPDEQYVPGPR